MYMLFPAILWVSTTQPAGGGERGDRGEDELGKY